MIYPVTYYEAKCDNCGEQWSSWEGFCAYGDRDLVLDALGNDEWHIDGEKHYCSQCHSINDNDEVEINLSRKKAQ